MREDLDRLWPSLCADHTANEARSAAGAKADQVQPVRRLFRGAKQRAAGIGGTPFPWSASDARRPTGPKASTQGPAKKGAEAPVLQQPPFGEGHGLVTADDDMVQGAHIHQR